MIYLLQTYVEIDASLQFLLKGNQYLNPPTKTRSIKGHSSAKIMRIITNIKLDLYFTMIYPSKTKSKKSHNSANVRMITNIKLDQYFTMIYLLQTYVEIDASLQLLLNGNQYLNPTTKKWKKGHFLARLLRTITNIERPVFYNGYLSANFC